MLLRHAIAQQDPVLVDAGADKILEVISDHKGQRPVLVNFWATWCAPCIEEFPFILELKKEYGDDFELIFVSGDFIDQRGDALEFLKEQGVDFATYFKTEKDNEFIKKISGQWTGALPFTIIFDVKGEVSISWEGKAEKEKFESELLRLINTQNNE